MDKCTICHVSVTEFRMRNLPCAQQRGLAKSTFTPRFFGTTDLHVNDGLYKSNSYSISLTLSQPPTVVAPQPGPVSVNEYKYKSNNRLAFGLDQFHTHTHTHDGRLQATLVPHFQQFMFRSARFTPFLLIYYV